MKIKGGTPLHVRRPGDRAVGLALRHEAARLKLVHAIAACHRSGLKVVVDADSVAIRLIPEEQYNGAIVDLRNLGETIPVDNACGGGTSLVRGLACNYGVK